MKRLITAVVLFISCITVLNAQTSDGTPKVSLVAMQVVHLDSSIRWYTQHLGFKIIEQKEYRDYNLRLAILAFGEFELELVETKGALDKSDVLKKANATSITGFAKLAFTVADIRSIYKKLETGGANIVFKLSQSNRNAGVYHFIVADNEGNWVQFLGK